MTEGMAIFAGETKGGEKIVLYRKGDELHLRLPNGEEWALAPGTYELYLADSVDTNQRHLTIESNVWSGEAIGSYMALMDLPAWLTQPLGIPPNIILGEE